jgi:hypothetical protein
LLARPSADERKQRCRRSVYRGRTAGGGRLFAANCDATVLPRLAAWRAFLARSMSEAAERNRPSARSCSACISASCAERSSVSATFRNVSATLLPSV